MRKALFIISLMFITLSCNVLNIYTENTKNINKTTYVSPRKRLPLKWWDN